LFSARNSIVAQGHGNPSDFPTKATLRLTLVLTFAIAFACWSEKHAPRLRPLIPWLIGIFGSILVSIFWVRNTLFIQVGVLLFIAPWIGIALWIYAYRHGKNPHKDLLWYHLFAILLSVRFMMDGHIFAYVFAAPALLLSFFMTFSTIFSGILPTLPLKFSFIFPFFFAWAILAGDSLAKYRYPWIELRSAYGSFRYSCRTPLEKRQVEIWQAAADWLRSQPEAYQKTYLYSITPGYAICFLAGMFPPQYTQNSGLLSVQLINGKLWSPDEKFEIEHIRGHDTKFIVIDTTPIWSATLNTTRDLLHAGQISGAIYFGKDYLPEINAFIQKNYKEVQTWKDPEISNGWSYELHILKKK